MFNYDKTLKEFKDLLKKVKMACLFQQCFFFFNSLLLTLSVKFKIFGHFFWNCHEASNIIPFCKNILWCTFFFHETMMFNKPNGEKIQNNIAYSTSLWTSPEKSTEFRHSDILPTPELLFLQISIKFNQNLTKDTGVIWFSQLFAPFDIINNKTSQPTQYPLKWNMVDVIVPIVFDFVAWWTDKVSLLHYERRHGLFY